MNIQSPPLDNIMESFSIFSPYLIFIAQLHQITYTTSIQRETPSGFEIVEICYLSIDYCFLTALHNHTSLYSNAFHNSSSPE